MTCAAPQLGILVRDWMRGYLGFRLESSMNGCATSARAQELKFDADATIRTMDDVEQIARFAAPKYLACYHDILAIHLGEKGESPTISTDDLTMMLELGVSSHRGFSDGTGPSATSAVAVSPLIESEDLSPEQVVAAARAGH